MAEDKELFPEDDSLDTDGSLGEDDGQVEDPVTDSDAGDQGDGGEPEGAIPENVKELMVKKGFKSVKDLVDSYSKLESSNTDLRSRVERLSYQPPPVSQSPQSAPELELPDDPVELVSNKQTLTKFVNSLKQNIHGEIANKEYLDKLRKGQVQMNRKMTEVGTERWEKLKPYMITVANQTNADDIDWIYGEAEKLEKQSKQRLLETVDLEEGDVAFLKKLKGRIKPAPVSGGSAPSDQKPAITVNSSPGEKASRVISNILNANTLPDD